MKSFREQLSLTTERPSAIGELVPVSEPLRYALRRVGPRPMAAIQKAEVGSTHIAPRWLTRDTLYATSIIDCRV